LLVNEFVGEKQAPFILDFTTVLKLEKSINQLIKYGIQNFVNVL
jgi:hypothetical protein